MSTTSRSRSKKHSSSKRSKRVHRKKKVNKTKKTKKSVSKMRGGGQKGGAGEVKLKFLNGDIIPIPPHYMEALTFFLDEEQKQPSITDKFTPTYNKNGYIIKICRDMGNDDYMWSSYKCITEDGSERFILDERYDIDEFCNLIKNMIKEDINPRSFAQINFPPTQLIKRKYFNNSGFKIYLSKQIKQHINEKDRTGKTALSNAFELYERNKDMFSISSIILECDNIDINIQDENTGETVLHKYLKGIQNEKQLSDKLTILQILLNKGGKMTIKDNNNIMPANLLFPLN
jgi:hypothetical protein